MRSADSLTKRIEKETYDSDYQQTENNEKRHENRWTLPTTENRRTSNHIDEKHRHQQCTETPGLSNDVSYGR